MLVRRASDLLSKWLGDSEKNIARMFAEARQQDAVLVLDEADSFLADRRGAQHSWEVTQVNELLTQMEAFDGIFVCTTNLMDRLDAASLRRFAFKVKFDFLTADQRWAMFRQELERLGGDVTQAAAWEASVRRLERRHAGRLCRRGATGRALGRRADGVGAVRAAAQGVRGEGREPRDDRVRGMRSRRFSTDPGQV